jgi:hypothetical protein
MSPSAGRRTLVATPRMSADDLTATSTDTITFPRRGEHEAAGVSLDIRLGSAA